ncbi:hypothetical protein GCM10023147_09950 [Tsukamurella soli]|uniref:Uncharacterized protein n=1 Tax=Tsukamurella soli TaxID=644556 RepID=A0ABP8J7X2_9ACTN
MIRDSDGTQVDPTTALPLGEPIPVGQLSSTVTMRGRVHPQSYTALGGAAPHRRSGTGHPCGGLGRNAQSLMCNPVRTHHYA